MRIRQSSKWNKTASVPCTGACGRPAFDRRRKTCVISATTLVPKSAARFLQRSCTQPIFGAHLGFFGVVLTCAVFDASNASPVSNSFELAKMKKSNRTRVSYGGVARWIVTHGHHLTLPLYQSTDGNVHAR